MLPETKNIRKRILVTTSHVFHGCLIGSAILVSTGRRRQLWLMHDAGPAHYNLVVRDYLN